MEILRACYENVNGSPHFPSDSFFQTQIFKTQKLDFLK